MNLTVYKSSAGSGKTYTLVKEYLKIALSTENSNYYRHILAITFTNKAAAEMRERVVATLKAIVSEDQPKAAVRELLKQLSQELKLEEQTIRLRAKDVLESILHNYSDLAISTIDKFMHKVLKAFAFDLKLPLNFDVEIETEEILGRAVDLLISRIGVEMENTRALLEFAEYKTQEQKHWDITYDLLNFAKNLTTEDGITHLDKIRQLKVADFYKYKSVLATFIAQFENSISGIALEAAAIISTRQINEDAFYQGKRGLVGYFNKLANKIFDGIVPNSYATATIKENKWYSSKVADTDKRLIDSVSRELTDKFNAIEKKREQEHAQYALYRLVYKNIYPLALLTEIDKILHEFRQKERIVRISEFNKIISDVVVNEPAPFIYERLGEKYKHFLIDEFQDTSILQFHNLLPLIDNSLAEGHFNMLVGDSKQAIYRFRGGEVEQFSKLPHVIKKGDDNFLLEEREENLVRNYLEKTLQTNYRSKTELVDFNNRFFRSIVQMLDPKFRDIYEALEQKSDPENTGGQVTIEFVDDSDTYEEANFEKVFQQIQILQSEKIPFQAMAVLCRTNTDAGNIAKYLLNKGINVISSEFLFLHKSPVVTFVVAAFKVINDSKDDIAKTEMLQYLINSKLLPEKNVAEIFNKIKLTKLPFFKYLRQNGFDFNIGKMSSLPLFDTIEKVIGTFRLNKVPDPYLQFFSDAVLSYSLKKKGNLGDFLTWWENNKHKKSVVIPEGTKAVTVMTVHKSKGLEFPIVFYPLIQEKARNTKEFLWVEMEEKQLETLKAAIVPLNQQLLETKFIGSYEEEKNKALLDLVNLLYVALTRPKERLYLYVKKTAKRSAQIDNLPELFIGFLEANGLWNEQQPKYFFGIKTPVPVKERDSAVPGSVAIKSFISEDWQEKILLSTRAKDRWKSNELEMQKEYGNLVHFALARIKEEKDIHAAVQSLVKEGLITEEEVEPLENKLVSIIQHPEVNQFFLPGLQVMNESEIITAEGAIYRPDRLIINDQKVVIIDYKTGKYADGHKAQLNQYAAFLSEIGFREVKKYLLYTERDELINLN